MRRMADMSFLGPKSEASGVRDGEPMSGIGRGDYAEAGWHRRAGQPSTPTGRARDLSEIIRRVSLLDWASASHFRGPKL